MANERFVRAMRIYSHFGAMSDAMARLGDEAYNEAKSLGAESTSAGMAQLARWHLMEEHVMRYRRARYRMGKWAEQAFKGGR